MIGNERRNVARAVKGRQGKQQTGTHGQSTTNANNQLPSKPHNYNRGKRPKKNTEQSLYLTLHAESNGGLEDTSRMHAAVAGGIVTYTKNGCTVLSHGAVAK